VNIYRTDIDQKLGNSYLTTTSLIKSSCYQDLTVICHVTFKYLLARYRHVGMAKQSFEVVYFFPPYFVRTLYTTLSVYFCVLCSTTVIGKVCVSFTTWLLRGAVPKAKPRHHKVCTQVGWMLFSA